MQPAALPALEDKRVIACNYRSPAKVARTGALCYVLDPNYGMGCERVRLLLRSRGGRWIDKWEDTRRLTHFRGKTLPPEHGRYHDVWGRFPSSYVSEEDTVELLRRASERAPELGGAPAG